MSPASVPSQYRPKPKQALSPWVAVAWFLAVPGLLGGAFLFTWTYPPFWVLSLVAFGPPVVGGAVVAAQRLLLGRWHPPTVALLVLGWIFSAFYTVFRVSDAQVVDKGPLGLASLAVAVAASPLLWRCIPPESNYPPPIRLLRRFGVTVFLVGFTMLYAVGTGALVNAQADIAPTQHFTAKVVAKEAYRGKHQDWQVTLAPWGPVRRSARHSVWREEYAMFETDGVACVDLHEGLLGLRWAEVGPCTPFVRPRERH